MKSYSISLLFFIGFLLAFSNNSRAEDKATDTGSFYYACRTHDNLDGENFWLYCNENLALLPHKTYMGTRLTGSCSEVQDQKTGKAIIYVQAHSGLSGTNYSSLCSKVNR